MNNADKMKANYNHFNDFIDNFDGLRNVNTTDDLKIANEAIDRLLFDVENFDA